MGRGSISQFIVLSIIYQASIIWTTAYIYFYSSIYNSHKTALGEEQIRQTTWLLADNGSESKVPFLKQFRITIDIVG